MIPALNGGSILSPYPKGVSGNPRGRPSKRQIVAEELLRKAGLEEVARFAHELLKRDGSLSRAILDAAEDPDHKGQVAAQKLAWDIAQSIRAREQEEGDTLEVRVVRKVRIMPGADEPDPVDEAREVELEASGAAPPDQSDSALCFSPTFSNSLEGGEDPEEREEPLNSAVPASHALGEVPGVAASAGVSVQAPPSPQDAPAVQEELSGPVAGQPSAAPGVAPAPPPSGLAPLVRADGADASRPEQPDSSEDSGAQPENLSGSGDGRVGKVRPPK